MGFFALEEKVLPDDHPPLPRAGTVEQKEMLASEERIGSSYEEYEAALDSVADMPFTEVLDFGIEAAAELLSMTKPEGGWRMLDVGAGTGLTAARFIRRTGSKVKELTLHDLSTVLADRARDYFARELPSVQTKTLILDLLDKPLGETFAPGSLDVVVTTNCFQHFSRDHQAKLFSDVASMLTEGGVFLNLAHLKTLTSNWKPRMTDLIASWAKGKLPPPALDAMRAHVDTSHVHVTLPLVFDWAKKAGFRFYDCPFRRHMYGMIVAVK